MARSQGHRVRVLSRWACHDQRVSETPLRPSQARPVRPRSLFFWPAVMVLVTAALGTLSWIINDGGDSGNQVPLFVTPVLDGADLAASTLRSSDLRGAHVDRTDLSGADLRGSDLSGVMGTGTILRYTCLRDTKWDKAVLLRVDLTGADLRGADFSRAKEIVPSSAKGVVVDGATKLPRGAGWKGTVVAAHARSDQLVC